MSSSKKSTLRSRFLESLPAEAQQHIFTLAGALSDSLREWVDGQGQLMRAVRVPPLCLTMAATASFLGVRELLPAARLSMWLFAVDDLCDEGAGDGRARLDEQLCRRLDRCVALLGETGGAIPEDPLARAMRDIREELLGFESFTVLRPAMMEELRALLRGMLREEQWSAAYRASSGALFPSSSDYLENAGVYSIGVLPVYQCLLVTMGDASIAPHLPRLMELGREAALSIRLANDLRSYERELAEGKLNSLGILQRELETRKGLEAAAALEAARAEVKARMADALARSVKLGRGARTDSSHPERYVTDLISFVGDFYAHHDYHHTLVKQDGNDIIARTSSGS